MIYVSIGYDCYALPIMKHLQDEDKEILVGVVEDREDLKLDESCEPEKARQRAERLSNHRGLLRRRPYKQILNKLTSVPMDQQSEYFFFFDFNDMYPIANQIREMGFAQGLFPTEQDYKIERERELAKKHVQKHYPNLKVAEAATFKTVEEGVAYINNSDSVYVLKSNGNLGKTVVPQTDDPKIARQLIEDALKKYTKEYEAQGYLLEKKILNALEVSPVLVFWNGEPVYSLAEFENKPYGCGDIGPLKGGCQALNVRTPLKCGLNDIAFPPIVYDIAKRRKGMYIADAGLLYDGKDFYFGEFAGNRAGWDGILAQLVMRDDGEPFVANFFEDVISGKNPLKRKYGTYIRLFNYEGGYEDSGTPKDDIPLFYYKSIEKNLFLYNVKLKDDNVVSVGGADFLGAITGSSDVLTSAINKTYKYLDKFHFERLYYRYIEDFKSTVYPTSIMNRYNAMEHVLS